MPNLHIIEMESSPVVNHKVIITLLDNTRVTINANVEWYSLLLTNLRDTIQSISVLQGLVVTNDSGKLSETTVGLSNERRKIDKAIKARLKNLERVC